MSPTLLGMLNTPEIIALLVLALLLFGAKKLPELARGLGHGIREFKKATRDVQDELSNAMNAEPPAPPPPSLPPAPEPTAAEPPPPPEDSTALADAVQPAETVSSAEPPKV
jgi:sec-independent protein translocase protein TatA